MPGTVDDFIQRFGGQKTMDEQEAAQHFDRFASEHPDDRDYDNQTMYSGASEYLGKLPDRDFHQAAQNAYAQASPDQQQGLVSSLLHAVQGRGGDASGLGALFGGSRAPERMSPDQYAQAATYLRQRHPEALQDVVREQPWLVKAMGNPVLMGVLGVVASRMVKGRMNAPARAPEQAGGLLGKILGKL